MSTEEALRNATTPTDIEDQPHDEVPGILDHLRQYAEQRPDVAALWCFGIGFVLGWKLKLW